jgi:hypothetical protein
VRCIHNDSRSSNFKYLVPIPTIGSGIAADDSAPCHKDPVKILSQMLARFRNYVASKLM